ncbi:uncharacterized protein DS421_15g499680 [Arachis hypogaea]|nr:uncharacterized protein DS421_15g499680 [Arachis hypogaea]
MLPRSKARNPVPVPVPPLSRPLLSETGESLKLKEQRTLTTAATAATHSHPARSHRSSHSPASLSSPNSSPLGTSVACGRSWVQGPSPSLGTRSVTVAGAVSPSQEAPSPS